MKNKKLFAILTLVCFMMTLMPVAAFADSSYDKKGVLTVSVAGANKVSLVEVKDGKVAKILATTTVEKGAVTFASEVVAQMEVVEVEEDTTTPGAVKLVNYATPLADGYYVMDASVKVGDEVEVGDELAPVTPPTPQEKKDAANDAISYDTSIFVATDGSDSVYVGDEVSYTLKLRDVYGNDLTAATAGAITVWAEEVSKPGVTNSALIVDGGTAHGKLLNAYKLTGQGYDAAITVSFARAGEYKVFAAETAAVPTSEVITTVDGIVTLKHVSDVISVSSTGTTIPQQDYTAKAAVTGATATGNVGVAMAEGNSLASISTVVANNINDVKVTVEFDSKGKDLTGKTISISTNSANLNVSKTTATTNALGVISFDLSAAREGQYKVFLSVDGCTWTIDVKCGNTAAAYIEVVEAPKALVPLYGTVVPANPTDGDLNVQVFITDINGNAVVNGAGVRNALNNNDSNIGNGKYVTFVTKPAASKLTNKDLKLVAYKDGNYVLSCPTLDAEGAYEVKIVLDNGNFVTVPFTVKEFQTPVRLILAYPQNSIELGGKLAIGKLAYMDANGVMKATTTPELAATGYAIADFKPYDATYLQTLNGYKDGRGVVTVKADEKYVGSTITVTAVDERYDLVATATLTVADEAAGLAFSTETAEVNVNNKITVNVVDAKGNKVALGANTNAATANISYVVLEKPADAKVSVYTADSTKLMVKGQFVMALTSDKVGNVKVQAVVKLTQNPAGVTASLANQVKYYTGTQEFAVGTGEVGKSVVMSIGSNELIVGSKVETMDAKPMIQNNRTFVPFRALAEAFGATVAYDQATSSVTAELNGVKVVMTVGAPVYTVNGVEKTADVAPFISDSRTFVPVRFAAEAFGIEVVPTYNEDGSVADVLFNM